MRFLKSIINNRKKKITMYSFVIYYPIISLLAGAPIPFPSLFDISPETVALFNFVSLLITIMGSFVGVAYYLEKRQNEKVNKIDEKIDEKTESIIDEMKDLEKRLCTYFTDKNMVLEKDTAVKVSTAKELVDTKFHNLDRRLDEHQKTIENMDRYYHKSNRFSKENNNHD